MTKPFRMVCTCGKPCEIHAHPEWLASLREQHHKMLEEFKAIRRVVPESRYAKLDAILDQYCSGKGVYRPRNRKRGESKGRAK